MQPPAPDPDPRSPIDPVPPEERFAAGEPLPVSPLGPEDDAAPAVFPAVEPNVSATKTIGILNIVFGVCLLLCGLCTGMNLAVQPLMGPMMAAQQQQFQQTMAAARQQQLQQLQQQEQATQDPKQKAALQAQRKAFEAQPLPKMPDMTQFMRNPRYQAYMLTDVTTGLLLNILMVIAGIGLVVLRDWARQMALWIAGLKIVRLIALYSYFIIGISPLIVRMMTGMIEEMAKAGPPGQQGITQEQIGTIATVYGAMMTAGGIMMILVGSIYPLIVLIVLTRPSVKAACSAPPELAP